MFKIGLLIASANWMPDSFEVARIRDLAGNLSLRLKGFLWLFIALMDVLRRAKSKREMFIDKIENQNANKMQGIKISELIDIAN